MTVTERELHLTPSAPGQRLDLFVLAHVDSLSRAQVQRMIRDGLVRVNDQVEKAGFKVKGGEQIRRARASAARRGHRLSRKISRSMSSTKTRTWP